MAPSDHHPLQEQNLYTTPTYEQLFPRSAQYGATPSWDQFNQSHSNLLPQASAAQSWQQNPISHQPYTSPYGNPNHGYQTAPAYQYQQYNSHGPMSNYGHPPTAIDPTLGKDPVVARQQQQSPYQQVMRNTAQQGQPTVTPQALQQSAVSLPHSRPSGSPFQIPKSTTELFAQLSTPTPLSVQPVNNPKYEVPKGKVAGGFSLIDQAALAKATQSIALNKLVNFGTQPLHLASNRTALPIYQARQSVKELKKAGAGKRKVLDKVAKKSSSRKILLSKSATAVKPTPGSPSLQRDVSDSESYSESSDESEYTDDEDDEPSPLPTSRPDEPHQAVRYDVIKTTWFPRKSQPSSEKIKASLRDFWEVLNTIQKRWRADSKAVTEAEEQKKTGELPVLKSRVASQRDLLQSALKSALEFGHADVLYHMGQIKPFLYLCYQFLANRFKMQDYDGALSSVIYQVLARCAGTLNTEIIEETKLIKALNSMKKNANEANKALIQQIIDGAAAGSKKPKSGSPPQDEVVDSKGAKRPATQPAGRLSAEGTTAKKLKASEPIAAAAKKGTPAPAMSKAAMTTNMVPQKRPGEKPTAAPVKARGNQVVNKPSSFFSTLNAATKKPAASAATPTASKPQPKPAPVGTAKDKKPASAAPVKPAFSFAETMAQLMEPKKETVAAPKPEKHIPNETPEEKVKRIRKESRRHLRVSFRPDASLVSIRYFHHDPDEETRHEENFVRDAGDIGGEGRMFKQHRDQEEEDEDDETERLWKEPTPVDFSRVDAAERERNFEPYGGGERKPECPEREANQRRENQTLMVFYTHPSDIPSSPREPIESDAQLAQPSSVRHFGAPPQFVLDRTQKPATPAPAVDFSSLEQVISQLANSNSAPPVASQSTYVPTPPTLAPVPDLSAILSALQTGSALQTAPLVSAAPAMPVPGAQPPAFDLNALLATMGQVPPPGGAVFPPIPPAWPQFPTAFPQPPQQTGLEYQPQQQQQQQQAQFSQQVSGSGKRQRDDGSNNNNGGDRGHGSFKKQKGNKNHHYTGDRPHKVIPCRFFQQGKCTKGDDCTFIHDRNMK